MLNKIPQINYEKCYPSRLKNFFKSDLNYIHYKEFVPYVKNPVVGNIPPEIISLFKTDKGRKIKEFQNALADITKYLRSCYHQAKAQNLIEFDFNDLDNLSLFEKTITSHANEYFSKILPEGFNVNLKFLGKGAWGNVFKFSIKNKRGRKIMHDKVLKVYHKTETPMSCFAFMHGNAAEANFWTFLKNAAGHSLAKTQFTKHYMSDLKNGFALTDYAGRGIEKTTAPLQLRNIFKLYCSDVSNKPLYNKLYDVGGFSKTKNFINDKVTFKYFKKLMHRSPKELVFFIENLRTKLQNPKLPHRDKIQKALELFEHQKQINCQISR